MFYNWRDIGTMPLWHGGFASLTLFITPVAHNYWLCNALGGQSTKFTSTVTFAFSYQA